MVTKIIAHRGSKGTAPENTIAAFQEAVRVGSDGIELDVHLSADGIPVVIHDETIDRTTNGSGWVKDMTVQELRQFDAGSWFQSLFQGQKIPTLAEVLLYLASKNFSGLLNIELKTDEISYHGIEQKVLEVVHHHQVTFPIVYSSFNFDTIERLLELDGTVDFALLFSKRGQNLQYLPSGKKVQAWHPHRNLGLWLLKHPAKLPLRVWTVNRTWEISFFLRNQIEALITDYPEKALKVRKMLQGE